MDVETAPAAMRNLQTFLKSGEKSMISMYPEDYQLFCLGSYDRTTGKVVGQEEPEFICSVLEAKAGLVNIDKVDEKELADVVA